MNAEELAQLRALCEAGTAGVWREETEQLSTRGKATLVVATRTNVVCRVGPVGVTGVAEDAAFIVAARTALPALLDEVARLRAALHAIYEGHGGGEHPITLSHIDTQVLARRVLDDLTTTE